jgi:hypothetical protein
MKDNKIVKVLLVILIIMVALDIDSNLLSKKTEAITSGRVQYKVISGGSIGSSSQYEKLLNDMSSKGWEFDHCIELLSIIVFRK